MEQLKPFLEFLRKFVQLSDEEFEQLLLPVITIRKFPKKNIVIKAGEVENHFNFILQGIARKYFKKGKEEINTQISFEGQILHAQESFHSRTASEYFIETIEPTTFASISYKDMENLYTFSHKIERLSRLVITHAMVSKDNFQMKMIKLTPRERFIDFVIRNPELMQRVPQKLLASFLNIKPETFSRFKHLVKGHSKERS